MRGARLLFGTCGCTMTREQLLTMRVQQVTHPDDNQRNQVLLEALARDGADYTIEKRYVKRDGSVVWVADRVSAIREDGSVRSIVAISFVQSSAAVRPCGFGANIAANSTLPVSTRSSEQFSQVQPPCIAVETITAGKSIAGRGSRARSAD